MKGRHELHEDDRDELALLPGRRPLVGEDRAAPDAQNLARSGFGSPHVGQVTTEGYAGARRRAWCRATLARLPQALEHQSRSGRVETKYRPHEPHRRRRVPVGAAHELDRRPCDPREESTGSDPRRTAPRTDHRPSRSTRGTRALASLTRSTAAAGKGRPPIEASKSARTDVRRATNSARRSETWAPSPASRAPSALEPGPQVAPGVERRVRQSPKLRVTWMRSDIH